MTTIKVASSSSKDVPMLLSFPGGISERTGDITLKVGKKKKRRLIVGKADKMDIEYRNVDNGASYTKKDTMKFAIGVYDSNNNELRIHAAEHAFVMKPQFEAVHEMLESSSTMKNWERKRGLVEAFASAKKKKAVTAAAAKRIDSEKIEGADTLQKEFQSRIDTIAQESGEITFTSFISGGMDGEAAALMEHRRKLLPFFDINADAIKYAYPLQRLITDDMEKELKHMYNDYSNKIKNNEYESWEALYSSNIKSNVVTSVSERVTSGLQNADNDQEIEGNTDDKRLKKKAKTTRTRLILLSIFIRLYIEATNFATQKRTDKSLNAEYLTDIPKGLAAIVFRRFDHIMKRANFRKQKMQMEKLLCHIIVLGLHMTKFELNVDTLANDLNLPIQHVKKLARETGCQVVNKKLQGTETTSNIATLKVPLVFPSVSKGPASK